MSERLYVTDAWLEYFAKSDLSHMRDLARELIERRAVDEHRRRSDEELRERRAADLSDEDREALTELVEWAGIAGIWDQWSENDFDQCGRVRALLDRLLSRGKDGR